MILAEARHQAVSVDLGDDRGTGYGGTGGIAFDHGRLPVARGKVGERLIAVDKDQEVFVRLYQSRMSSHQTIDGSAHGEQTGLQDIDLVNLLDSRYTYSKETVPLQTGIQSLSNALL